VTPCPQCGEPTERGQLVCVNCGTRLALREPPTYAGPPRSAIPALVILLAVVVIGAGAVGFALSEITGDDGGGGGGNAQSGGGQTQTTQTSTSETETATEQRSKSPLLEWPKGVTGYTVVLVTTADHAAARRVALQASSSGLEAGLLRSDDYDLGTGLWIVFAGRFDTRASASRQATNLAGRYPGAYAQLVKPVS
jgi:zinc-ribbon domain/SPOR domain